MDREAWRAAVHGVAESTEQLKQAADGHVGRFWLFFTINNAAASTRSHAVSGTGAHTFPGQIPEEELLATYLHLGFTRDNQTTLQPASIHFILTGSA